MTKTLTLKQVIKKYKNCDACILHKSAHSYVFYRGDNPPLDILFIGEAPGNTEDLYGEPFVGISGELLEQLIKECQNNINININCGFTNLVCCRPLDDQGALRKPTVQEAMQCSDRLQLTIEACKPHALVLLGRSAASLRKILYSIDEYPILELKHPAHLLRKGGANSFEYQESCLFLEEFIQEHFGNDPLDE